MMIKKLIIAAFLHLVPCLYAALFAQNFRFPLDKPLSMSANFGELRANHFHAGIDLRVGGAAGAGVFAIDSGFVSRIYISPTGYGKALYIEHPNGYTSVYAHLDAFAGKIADYTEEYQYKRQRFTVNDYTDSTLLPVKRGELIGYAGNTGSSFGAHLHFEIRESLRQAPLNSVSKGFVNPKDNKLPVFHSLAIFTLDTINDITRPRLLKSERTIGTGISFVPEKTTTFEVCNPVFFGINANDYQPENRSKHGIFQMKVYMDNELFFSYKKDEFEFADTRYINSFIAYDEFVKRGTLYVKTYVEEGNGLKFYENVKNNGLLILRDTVPHNVRVEIFDDSKNKSVLNFKIRRSNKVAVKHQTVNIAQFIPMRRNANFEYQEEGLSLAVEENSLYSDALFKVVKTPKNNGTYSPLWSLGYNNIPLHKHINLRIKPVDLPSHLKPHAAIAKKTAKGITYCGGKYDAEGFLSVGISEFGDYFVTIDTIPPTVSVTSKTANFGNQTKLTVLLSDNFSGIESYNGYIDGQWVLFEYDPKNKLMFYSFNKKQMGEKGKKRKLKVIVTDNCKNTATYLYDFVY
jgi:hypothetical protein